MQKKVFLPIFTLLTLLTFLTSSPSAASLRSPISYRRRYANGCVAPASHTPQPPHTHFTGNMVNQPDLISGRLVSTVKLCLMSKTIPHRFSNQRPPFTLLKTQDCICWVKSLNQSRTSTPSLKRLQDLMSVGMLLHVIFSANNILSVEQSFPF
jgi:hypothetical protein